MPNCRECNTPIPIEEETPDVGDILTCPACGAEHEVICSDPVEIELIEEEK